MRGLPVQAQGESKQREAEADQEIVDLTGWTFPTAARAAASPRRGGSSAPAMHNTQSTSQKLKKDSLYVGHLYQLGIIL